MCLQNVENKEEYICDIDKKCLTFGHFFNNLIITQKIYGYEQFGC